MIKHQPPVRHHQIRVIVRDYKRAKAQIREGMNSECEHIVLDTWKFVQMKLKETHKYILKVLLSAKELAWIHKNLEEEVVDLIKTRDMLYDELSRLRKAKAQQRDVAYFSEEEEKRVQSECKAKQHALYTKHKEVVKLEQEYIIKQEELQTAIRDTNLAKSSYYFLTDKEIELFEVERPKILAGIEKYGSISLALKNDASIKMRASAIMHYAQKHEQFAKDMEIAKQVFKDSVDAELIDRALHGTTNPVFQKGEYIGDYAVKDNKLLVELAKAKLPETYNPRVYAAANPQGPIGTTINILSFDGVDETKHGYAKNIGVVKSVDESGRVERITQAKKMLEFYKEKGTAEIIMPYSDATMPLENVIEAEVINDTKNEFEEE